MKKFMHCIAVALIVWSLSGVTALANDKSGRVSFPEDYSVNGTLIKKGSYKVKFDEQAKELTIFLGNSKTVKTSAWLEKRARKARRAELSTTQGEVRTLRSITLGGDDEAIVIGDKSARTESAQ